MNRLETVRLRAKTPIYLQGDDVENFFLVRNGLLGIYRLIYPDKKVLVGKVADGDPVVISQLMLDEPFPAMLSPIKESIAYRGTKEDLHHFSQKKPEWLTNLLLHENHTQSNIYQKIEDVIGKELDQRIAQELLDLAGRIGRRTDSGIEIVIKLTRKHISEMIGCAQESVIRILSSWEKKGWIETDRKYITLRRPEALQGLLENA